ncbi:hypothetical protein ACLKA6_016222 [Drosophila palustris]
MDTFKKFEKPNKAEQPPQPDFADLSTAVKPMDAENGLDLDPYSPVSNSNTEEIEELLRVEEEILNSPPKAETAPKGCRVRLSGAARKHLSYYRTKGVPLEQALVLARQPIPKSEKGRKAESSRKRERSANTTPETKLAKPGSAKPGAGNTTARVPEIKAVSTDQKVAQPLTSRPTEPGSTAPTVKSPER